MWAILTESNLIRQTVEKLSPFTKIAPGERIVKYEPPRVDNMLYLVTPKIPVTGDFVEFNVEKRTIAPEIYKKQQAAKVQKMLDTEAQKRGYDNILSAVTYGFDNTSPFYAEAIAFAKWRSQCWEICFANSLEENLLDLMPKFEEVLNG